MPHSAGSVLCHNLPNCSETYLTPSILDVNTASTPPAGREVDTLLSRVSGFHPLIDTVAVIDKGCLEVVSA